MPLEFLTHEEICQLTGAKTKAGQVCVLKQNGIRHTIKMNGWPAVSTHAVTGEHSEEPAVIPWRPNKA
ncbi:TPA: DUF4224 domain-containing protein [Pseudomonas aeruginosa]|uniref:DUF4224 domain-containing protein n=1 Tax=Pseudomonas aeruginosa TaxID=287 RepID=UPI00104882F8|nr:DUF4224 domain-containing protein [Pseudomonas aeruginosa]HCE6896223.1 DUF4224 domain-containing protein [Pseudomonas aeruginosa]HCE6904743.1 DUF4224 domain-containing protein [Pseudomonas aeruginosa]HCE7019131.1 DUF4224 domain-containing protein [Pseudomonas aeruginosa]HCE7063552.1 DUF4224 domain-containing protein [Pseudomonas aeruginosa]HCE7349282.1 DUF4224 domain-containing protein [Pseudomonas aeruginosa]